MFKTEQYFGYWEILSEFPSMEMSASFFFGGGEWGEKGAGVSEIPLQFSPLENFFILTIKLNISLF